MNTFLVLTVLVNVLLLVSSNPSGRTKRAAWDCRSAGGQYISYWNTDFSNHPNQGAVHDCFEALKRDGGGIPRFGCRTYERRGNSKNCACTHSNSFIWDAEGTFNEALNHLRKDSGGFTSIEAERYEGSMYITYTCR